MKVYLEWGVGLKISKWRLEFCLDVWSFLWHVQENSNYMDKNFSGKEVSEENTRESLIAISYTEPQEEPNDKKSTKKLSDNNVAEAMESDIEDKYRSKLISISNSESPDKKALPVLPGDVEG